MFIDTSSIVINTVSFGQYITEAKFGYHKLWAEDSGRNLAGVQSGTLIGIFPKITLQFRKLSKSELEIVAPILDLANQTLTYYDPNKKANTTITTYTGDWEIVNRGINQNEGFSCAFISTSKRV
jgi:hypothetical protein